MTGCTHILVATGNVKVEFLAPVDTVRYSHFFSSKRDVYHKTPEGERADEAKIREMLETRNNTTTNPPLPP